MILFNYFFRTKVNNNMVSEVNQDELILQQQRRIEKEVTINQAFI